MHEYRFVSRLSEYKIQSQALEGGHAHASSIRYRARCVIGRIVGFRRCRVRAGEEEGDLRTSLEVVHRRDQRRRRPPQSRGSAASGGCRLHEKIRFSTEKVGEDLTPEAVSQSWL